MKTAKMAFSGTNGALLNYCADIRNIQITRQSTGKYTVTFLTPCSLDESKVVYPIINVTCQSPTGSATVVNVLNPTASYQAQNKSGYYYLVSLKIETKNVVNSVTLPSSILTLLGYTFNVVTFVDRPIVMMACELSECFRGLRTDALDQ